MNKKTITIITAAVLAVAVVAVSFATKGKSGAQAEFARGSIRSR